MSEPKIIDLVFEGGGMQGVAFLSALKALDTCGYRPGRLLGSSIGSLFAALLAAGYSPNELYEQAFDFKTGELRLSQYIKPFSPFTTEQIDASATRRFLEVIDFPFVPDGIEGGVDTLLARSLMRHPMLASFFAFVEKGGTWNLEPFMDWLESFLDAKIAPRSDIPSSTMTMAQFHKVTGSLLSIIAADITNPTMLILNHITAPDCPILQTIRMGLAEPTLFPAVTWEAEWGLYRRQELTGDLIVDGVFLSNFPIELFLSRQEAVTYVMGEPDEMASTHWHK